MKDVLPTRASPIITVLYVRLSSIALISTKNNKEENLKFEIAAKNNRFEKNFVKWI
jgi:hypothetical protein